MKQLTCEMCGATDLIKEDGVFVCQSCGTKYSVEEARKMIIEGTVDVTGSTVKIDTSGELANLYQIARRARDDNNGENAARYYDMVLIKDPTSWEASFYVVYFRAMECKIAEIESAAISVSNCINTVLKLIKDHVSDKEEQKDAYIEVAHHVMLISRMLFQAATNYYNDIDIEILGDYTQKWIDNGFAAIHCVYILGDSLDVLFSNDQEANRFSVYAWDLGVKWHLSLIDSLADKKGNNNTINRYISKIKTYDSTYIVPTVPAYITPQENSDEAPQESSGGCYVATAVYGSYDCPQVWTLRRFRDYTLAEIWYGRAFIRTYYAISPTLVKYFGHTRWFKKMWKGKLDRMVASLNAKGVEDTPYEDRNW